MKGGKERQKNHIKIFLPLCKYREMTSDVLFIIEKDRENQDSPMTDSSSVIRNTPSDQEWQYI